MKVAVFLELVKEFRKMWKSQHAYPGPCLMEQVTKLDHVQLSLTGSTGLLLLNQVSTISSLSTQFKTVCDDYLS